MINHESRTYLQSRSKYLVFVTHSKFKRNKKYESIKPFLSDAFITDTIITKEEARPLSLNPKPISFNVNSFDVQNLSIVNLKLATELQTANDLVAVREDKIDN